MTTRIYLTLPSYENHEVDMMQVAYRGAVPDGHDYLIRACPRKGCSLLANAFNSGWVDCLNSTSNPQPDNGGPFDYWCLLHGDVEPSEHFLHVMIQEMEEHKLNALHAVVAIKDNRGITSTGIGPISRKWSPTRKITTTELQQLPQTFTISDCLQFLDWGTYPVDKNKWVRWKQIEDDYNKTATPAANTYIRFLLDMIGEVPKPFQYPRDSAFGKLIHHPTDTTPVDLCLLANTGCLLVKLDDWCWEFPGFVIEDRLVEDINGTEKEPLLISRETRRYTDNVGDYEDHHELSQYRGMRKTQNVPEDWAFGRWMARKGLRMGATTKVTTRHWGKLPFVTSDPWGGEKTDQWYLGCKTQMEPT